MTGLFRSLNHSVIFPTPSEEASQPSLVILHGRNGIGKTTLLRMLDGMMRLDFNTFRRVPFSTCTLTFTTGDAISVRAVGKQRLEALEVSFAGQTVLLNSEIAGSLTETDAPKVDLFRATFFKAVQSISFEFIDTERVYQLVQARPADIPQGYITVTQSGHPALMRSNYNPKAKDPLPHRTLAERVADFIRDAQVNYRTFFSATEPDLFAKIIERLTSSPSPSPEAADLKARLTAIYEQDKQTSRLGLEPDRWDYDQLVSQLDSLSQKSADVSQHALTVLGSFVEVLESRAAERNLVATRLFAFERLLSEFFLDKKVTANANDGILIATGSGLLNERQLSSGEFHLLFLMVAALVTRRRGTVIAIDEPEMSMHIGWQRKLVPALLECASMAEPLFILATHSPDIAAAFPEAMVELTAQQVDR